MTSLNKRTKTTLFCLLMLTGCAAGGLLLYDPNSMMGFWLAVICLSAGCLWLGLGLLESEKEICGVNLRFFHQLDEPFFAANRKETQNNLGNH
jgi:hypothetical protein